MLRRATLLGALLLCSSAAHAFVLGGGSADGDCRVAFGGVDANVGAIGVVCADGDACDADGAADCTCRFDVSVCTAVPLQGCAPTTIDRIAVAGLPLADPPLPSGNAEACGPPATVTVPAGMAAAATLLARGGGGLRDVDYLNLCCRPPSEPLAAARCAVDVDLEGIAGCTTAHVPRAMRTAFANARKLVQHAADSPGHSRRAVRHAARILGKVRSMGQRLADKDDCGFALSLVASHAIDALAGP